MHTGSLLLTKMQTYLSAFNLLKVPSDAPLFRNHVKQKFTRNGISYLLQKYADNARVKTPSLIPEKVSPHMFRHSKAMHLVLAGVNIIYIRDFLPTQTLELLKSTPEQMVK